MRIISFQSLIIACLTALSLTANLDSTPISEKRFRTSARNLDYQRPPSAISFITHIKGAVAVDVDFGSDYPTADNLTSPKRMLLEISSIRTILNSESSLFKKYAYDGRGFFSDLQESFAHFTDSPITAYVKITGSAWVLANNNAEILENSLSNSHTYLTDTENTYGWIGLAAATYLNFPNSVALFSIYIEDVDSGDGWILFDIDSGLTNSSSPLLSLPTGPTWELLGGQFSLNGQNGPSETCAAISDLQYGKQTGSSMALPNTSFTFLIQTLGSLPDVQCTQESCTYSGADVNSLPNIEFQGMNISASVYMTKQDDGTYITNFARYDSNWNQAMQIIVFGWKVLSQYYFVFQASEDQSTRNLILYARPEDTLPADNPNNSTSNSSSETGNSTQPEPAGNNSSSETGNSTQPEPAGNNSSSETGNSTQPEPAGNNTSSETGNSTQPEPAENNSTANNNDTSATNTTQPVNDDTTTGSPPDPEAKDPSNSNTLPIVLCVITMLVVGLAVYFVNKKRSIKSHGDEDENNVEAALRASEVTMTSSQRLKARGNSSL